METSTNHDKRAFERFANREPVQIQFVDSEYTSGCLSHDISQGGVKFVHNDFIPLKQEVSMEVTLGNQEVVHCTGHVAWVQKMPHSHRYQVGIQFADDSLIFDARSRINSFFERDSQ